MLYCYTIDVIHLAWNEIGKLINDLDRGRTPEQFFFDLNTNELIYHFYGDALDKNDVEEKLSKYNDIRRDCESDSDED